MLSQRSAWNLHGNTLSDRLEATRASGRPLHDLTESDPARRGLGWDPAAPSSVLLDPRVAAWDPSPRGPMEARAAVTQWLASRDAAALHPGLPCGFERPGRLVASLLPSPEAVRAERSRLAARLGLG